MGPAELQEVLAQMKKDLSKPVSFDLDGGRAPQRALQSLQGSSDPLGVISAACGFADRAHMSREFRAMLATTPRSLRRSLDTRAASPIPYVTNRDLLSTGLLVLSGSA